MPKSQAFKDLFRATVATRRDMVFGVVMAVAWAAGLLLGAYGLRSHLQASEPPATKLDIAYQTVKLINLGAVDLAGERPWTLELARWVLPLLAATTLIGGIRILFRENWRWMRMRRRGRHIVICGLSRKGYLLAEQFHNEGRQVVIVERDPNNGWLEDCRLRGDLVIVGDATAPEILGRAAAAKASWVFAVCNNEGTNAEIAQMGRNGFVSGSGTRHDGDDSHSDKARARAPEANGVRCRAHLADPDLGHWLGNIGVLDPNDDDEPGRVEAFNVFELGAPLLLDEYDPFTGHERHESTPPRLLVVGLGCFGAMVVVEAARRWARLRSGGIVRLRIVAVALDARDKIDLLREEYKDDLVDVDLEPIELDVSGAEYRRGAFLLADDGRPRVDYVYVCIDDDALGIRAALALRKQLALDTPIVVRVSEERRGLGALLSCDRSDDSRRHSLFAFPLLTRTCTSEGLRMTARPALDR